MKPVDNKYHHSIHDSDFKEFVEYEMEFIEWQDEHKHNKNLTVTLIPFGVDMDMMQHLSYVHTRILRCFHIGTMSD